MNCYRCDDLGRVIPAVATCNHCGIGLCRTHLDEDLIAIRPHGLTRRACTHDPLTSAERGRRPNLERSPVPL